MTVHDLRTRTAGPDSAGAAATPRSQRHGSAGPAVRACDVMTSPVQTVEPHESLWSAWSVMLDASVHHVVVVGPDNHCVGVLDDRTLFAHWPVGPFAVRSTLVRDLLEQRVSTVTAETPLADVARLMVRDQVDAVPVVSARGAVVGIVTGGDIAAAVARLGLGAGAPDNTSPAGTVGRDPARG